MIVVILLGLVVNLVKRLYEFGYSQKWRNSMEMRNDGTCSILNEDCPEKKLTDCRECQLHCVFEDYRNRAYRMQEESEE